VGAQAFESIVGRIDYPMYIVTALVGGERDGCLVGFTTQCSIDPARFLVCMSDKNRTTRLLEQGGGDAMVVHLVPEAAGGIVELFGAETGDDTDKFERCEWSRGPEGIPLLADCPSWFAGRIVERMRLGDHIGHVLEPFAGDDPSDGGWFPFSRAQEIEPGHEA
jgi:flavin reductase (DIM6/NTAB) family NADH-FMN oxidoreductase RutF